MIQGRTRTPLVKSCSVVQLPGSWLYGNITNGFLILMWADTGTVNSSFLHYIP